MALSSIIFAQTLFSFRRPPPDKWYKQKISYCKNPCSLPKKEILRYVSKFLSEPVVQLKVDRESRT